MTSHPPAYTVPFWVDRREAPRLHRVVNLGNEVVHGLRFSLLGSGHLVPVSPSTLAPGAGVTLTLLAADSRDSIVVLRWFRPGGDEYLWRFSL